MKQLLAPPLPSAVYSARKYAVLLLLGCLCFVAVSWFIFMNPRHYQEYFDQAIAVAGALFFGAGVLIAIRIIIRPRLLFAFTKEGIEIKKGKPIIPWSAIADVRIVGVQRQKFVGIFLHDPQIYYAALSKVSRKVAEMNASLVGTPVVLNGRLAGMSNETILRWLETYRGQKPDFHSLISHSEVP